MGRMVVNIRTAVVLPAPFGPSRPSTVPVGTARLTPLRAWTSPKCFTNESATMASAGGEGIGPLYANVLEQGQVFIQLKHFGPPTNTAFAVGWLRATSLDSHPDPAARGAGR